MCHHDNALSSSATTTNRLRPGRRKRSATRRTGDTRHPAQIRRTCGLMLRLAVLLLLIRLVPDSRAQHRQEVGSQTPSAQSERETEAHKQRLQRTRYWQLPIPWRKDIAQYFLVLVSVSETKGGRLPGQECLHVPGTNGRREPPVPDRNERSTDRTTSTVASCSWAKESGSTFFLVSMTASRCPRWGKPSRDHIPGE